MIQYDLETPVNLPALSSITQQQLLAALNTLKPIYNIGGVIVMSGASSAHPDVTNNPRFVRYVWLDTQTAGSVLIKVYQGTYPSDTYADWATITIADGSITAAKLANYAVSVLNLSSAPKIAYLQTGAADATKSNYMLRLDAAGQYVEVVALAPLVAALTLNPAKLDISTATNGMVLTYDSSLGSAIWKAISITGLISANSLSYDKLLNATIAAPGYILRSNPATGVWEAIVPNDLLNTIFPVHTIPLTKLDVTAAVASDGIRFDGTNWVRTTPYYAVGAALSAAVTGNSAHGLGAVPRFFTGSIKLTTADAATGYAVNDIVDINNFITGGANPALGISADATNLTYTQFNTATIEVRHKTTGAATAITEGNWNWVFYASL